MSMTVIIGIVALSVWVYVTLLFGVSFFIKRNDIADIAWGPGIALVGLVALLATKNLDVSVWILFALVSLWALRLAVRIGRRVLSHREEDPRYKQWRESWKYFYVRSYAQVYLLQGALMILMGYPIAHMAVYGAPTIGGVFILGLVVWLVGFLFEVVGDTQLDRFLKNKENKGKIMQSGLWRYSRHPNYFGEVTLWWGIWISLIGVPYYWVALMSPILISILILKVSGVPMLEKLFEGNPAFEEYKKRTSVFFPLPPKKTAS